MRDASQWVHGMGQSGSLLGGDAELQRGSVRNAAELSGERSRQDELRSGQRELLHESGGAGRDLRPNVHEQRNRSDGLGRSRDRERVPSG